MSGIAVAADWTQPDAGEESVRRMLAAMPHRSPDGTRVARLPHCVLGFALRATTAREWAAAQPLHDPLRGLWIVGDARIDNRDDLCAALGVKVPPSDVELLLLGYEKWGRGLAERLHGDFAFAIWNERDRSLYAARDAFGMRPLFYRHGPGRLLVASEVDALLATREFGWEIADQTVADFLARNRYRDHGRTFFREVRRLPPGHWMAASEAGLEQRRWFVYPDLPCHTSSEGEDAAEFRHRFRRAVADRLDSEGPIFSELSGGLDSASIACMADAIHREDGADRPPLTLASALYPGFACDERPYVEAVERRVRLRCEAWDATATHPGTSDPWPLAGPWREDAAFASPDAQRLARAAGARAILTGAGGDTLLFEAGVFRDLATRGRLVRLARETLLTSVYAATPGRDLFLEALRAAVPGAIRRAFRRMKPPPLEPPPGWLGPRLRPAWRQSSPPDHPAAARSWTQRLTWAWLTAPTSAWHIEIGELLAARHGLQLRCPFLDRRLAAWVLAVPWQRRLPQGRMKRLLREAMRELLPPEVAERRAVTVFDDFVAWSARRAAPRLAPLLAASRWESAGYVDQGAARALLTSVERGASSAMAGADLRNIAMLESWLRLIDGADRRRAGMAESGASESSGPGAGQPADGQVREEYRPPEVRPLGNLRDLLGKTGPSLDNPHNPNNPTRP
jgi:asparagine synthase (glutamine-hydrolysing)